MVVPTDSKRSSSAHCHRKAGRQICCEQITLQAAGAGKGMMPGTVLQLLVGDMPVYTVWRRQDLASAALLDPLCDLTDRLIVNSAIFEDPIARIAELKQLIARESGPCVADIEWGRLEPWREALASFFDIPALREYLARIARVAVTSCGPVSGAGRTAASAYLVGWLASRLGWRPTERPTEWVRPDGGRVECELTHDTDGPDGRVVAARLELGSDDAPVVFEAERTPRDSAFVRLAVQAPGSCPLPRRIMLPPRDEVALLCGALQRAGADPLYEQALALIR